LRRPSLRLAIEINQRLRGDDEWFEEPDDLERCRIGVAIN